MEIVLNFNLLIKPTKEKINLKISYYYFILDWTLKGNMYTVKIRKNIFIKRNLKFLIMVETDSN